MGREWQLYKIDNAIEQALSCIVDQETGEMVEDNGELERLISKKKSLVLDIACFIKELRSQSEALKAEEIALKTRRQRLDGQVARLEDFLIDHTERIKYSDSRCEISWRKSETVEITVPFDEIPEIYVKEKIELQPKKDELKKALKENKIIEGVSIITHQNIQIK